MKNNITTRQGDHGTTSLADGTIVTKNDQKIEACGTLDELNCHVGLLLTMNLPEEYADLLHTVQRRLFAIGASMSGTTYPKDFPTEMHIMQMEQFINTAPPSAASSFPAAIRRLPSATSAAPSAAVPNASSWHAAAPTSCPISTACRTFSLPWP